MSAPESPVLVVVQDGIGRITLNRPRAINALNHTMVGLVRTALETLSTDDDVSFLLIDGAGDRGLCAGGDIRAIYDDARAGGNSSIDFWRDEYRMDRAISGYPKPVVTLMDGLVMGGGVGVSAHASHRIVTERSVVAMPEVNIGLSPDVGGTYLLARAPGWLGLHAALTGVQLGAGDVIALGLADYFVAHADLPDLRNMLAVHGLEKAIYSFAAPPPAGVLAGQREWIDRCYNWASAAEIVANLRAENIPEATAAADAISAASPLSVAATLTAIRAVRESRATLEQALNLEYRMVGAAVRSADLVEGIRAAVIDKDRTPHWSVSEVGQVTDEQIAAWFEPIPDPPFPTAPEIVPASSRESVR